MSAMQETWFDPSVGKVPWRRECQPMPVFLPGESHEQRSLAGYSPWGHKDLDMTEQCEILGPKCFNCGWMLSHLRSFNKIQVPSAVPVTRTQKLWGWSWGIDIILWLLGDWVDPLWHRVRHNWATFTFRRLRQILRGTQGWGIVHLLSSVSWYK